MAQLERKPVGCAGAEVIGRITASDVAGAAGPGGAGRGRSQRIHIGTKGGIGHRSCGRSGQLGHYVAEYAVAHSGGGRQGVGFGVETQRLLHLLQFSLDFGGAGDLNFYGRLLSDRELPQGVKLQDA